MNGLTSLHLACTPVNSLAIAEAPSKHTQTTSLHSTQFIALNMLSASVDFNRCKDTNLLTGYAFPFGM